MKKIGLAMVAASGLGAAIVVLAIPAQATTLTATPAPVASATIATGIDHIGWLDQIHHKATAPKVDTTVRGGR